MRNSKSLLRNTTTIGISRPIITAPTGPEERQEILEFVRIMSEGHDNGGRAGLGCAEWKPARASVRTQNAGGTETAGNRE